MRTINKARIRAHELWKIGRGLVSTDHPILAHLVPMRRCNLACTYCNEFDDYSPPVPLPDMAERVERLAELGTSIVTISGGEPTLHPELDEIIRRIRSTGMIASLITNGYFLTPERIERLNEGGPGAPSDQHRQRDAGRRFQEVTQSSRHEAPEPGASGGVLREHQLGHRWRDRDPRGCHHGRGAGGRARLLHDPRHHPRRCRAVEASRRAGDGGLRPASRARQEELRAFPLRFGSISLTASRTAGAVGPVLATSISARTAGCITAPSSAVIPAFRSPPIRGRISSGSTIGPRPAPPTAPSPVSSSSDFSTTGARLKRASPTWPVATRRVRCRRSIPEALQ